MQKLILTLALVLTATGVFAQHSLKGTVVDDATGSPVFGANVTIESIQKGTSTNAEGKFELNNIPPGTYNIKVSMISYTALTRTVEVVGSMNLDLKLKSDLTKLESVVVTGTRASEKTPTTFSEVSKEEIEQQNLGQDLPFLLNWTPSVVVTSDAGAGVGYTGIRIRGSDGARINVTINGIPVNDSESQGTFWVNMPDLATSTDNVQVQRGVGTSTNGAGAFGGSINIATNNLSQDAEASINTSVGSFNTQKYNGVFKTGLLENNFAFEGRLSNISSDGYIDRASSDLSSYYLSGGYYGKKTILKLITFAGKERTYQSWYGTPEAKIKNDAAGIDAVIANNGLSAEQAANLRNSGRTYNFYDYRNQVDDYKQAHYQAHFSHQINEPLSFNTSLHYTKGAGFFEEYKANEDFADYGLNNVTVGATTIESTDLIRRRWLDNDFYGVTYGLNYETENLQANFGGAYNEYKGDHFGEIIWAEYASNSRIGDRYYESTSEKTDFNNFVKVNYQANDKINLYGDLQVRTVNYASRGNDNDLKAFDFDNQYSFFNPKLGLTYQLNANANAYISFARANKEPNRSDIIDAPTGADPKSEQLNNLEVGYRVNKSKFAFEANYYLMDYKDQLVLTGEVNDVGSSIRTNVADSYRMGIELQAGVELIRGLELNANLTLSENKIKNFEEVLYDYGAAFDEYNEVRNNYTDADISYSPSVIAGGQLTYKPTSGLSLSLLSKYVGDQYLDNTSNENRKIDAFFINDFRVNYSIKPSFVKELTLNLLVNNIFNVEYESNGYTFGYFGGANYEVRENYLYPQAGTNFLLSLGLKL
ncbi:TonB-dependent receptor [Roseivirga echinicomitans]|uniref:TonB-dependent receptor n=1 Tax=Roseivirga echinicomitans TaxID=296218 RepID=A0A150XX04_9BACT|nr:TonB-dependent receptor [Roseivirga echinicomitans]KYG83290.1 TonB-dependent receptor [Roseivirga echinicomitans]